VNGHVALLAEGRNEPFGCVDGNETRRDGARVERVDDRMEGREVPLTVATGFSMFGHHSLRVYCREDRRGIGLPDRFSGRRRKGWASRWTNRKVDVPSLLHARPHVEVQLIDESSFTGSTRDQRVVKDNVSDQRLAKKIPVMA
jgi:hypothetical protein